MLFPSLRAVLSTATITIVIGIYLYQHPRTMASYAARIAFNSARLSTAKTLPVGVFVGGTSGIGQGLAEAFARHTGGNAKIILVGRNRQNAETIIATFPKPTSSEAVHEFVECDVSLMSNIHEASSSILSRVPKINYLVYSAGLMTTAGYTETTEGIDRKLAVHYYGRWKFANELMPGLVKAKDAGEDAKAVFVLSAGSSDPINLEDLGLKKTYSLSNAAGQGCAYNDHLVQELASRYPTMSFGHIRPGFVRTQLTFSVVDSVLWKSLVTLLFKLSTPISYSITQSGENLLYGMLNQPAGWGGIGPKGEVVTIPTATKSARKALWEHSANVTGSAA